MSNEEKFFPEGFIFKEPNENAPDFVKGKVSIKKDEFMAYLGKVKGDWLNLDLKISKGGKAYAEVNTWKPDADKKVAVSADVKEMEDDGLPF